MKPTIGRIVIFHVPETMKPTVNYAEQLPAMIVRVWNDTLLNLKVITDGIDDLWLTSILEGINPNQWSWPIKEEVTGIAESAIEVAKINAEANIEIAKINKGLIAE